MTNSKIKEAFEKLNPPQQTSVREDNPRLLILAGAGAGKTSTLVVRVTRHLIKDKFLPHEIVGLTFTNKAGNELKGRVGELIGEEKLRNMFFGTFHSFCVRILRKNHQAANLPENFHILDEDDKKKLLKGIWKKNLEQALSSDKEECKSIGLNKDETKRRLDAIRLHYSSLKDGIKIAIEKLGYAKNRGHGLEWIKSELEELGVSGQLPQDVADFTSMLCEEYESEKEKYFMLDFDDLIIRTNTMLKSHTDLREGLSKQIKALLIDEFQDTNIIQYELMKLLINRTTKLTVVGDEDQLIYEWRGAILENILKFCEKESGICIKLEQNYRSTKSILGAANDVIQNNENRYGKTLFTSNNIGEPIAQTFYPNAYEEADSVVREIAMLNRTGVPFKNIAILYRNKSMSGAMENSLHKHNIPSVVYGGTSFWERKEIKDVLAFLKWIDNGGNALSIVRILERLKIGYGEMKHIEVDKIATSDSISYDQALRKFAKEGKSSKLKIALNHLIALRDDAKSIYEEKGLYALVEFVVRHSGFIEIYKKTDDEEAIAERRANLEQIIETAEMFGHEETNEKGELLDDLLVFLANADLQVEAQSKRDKDAESVSLMTIHASKGLEYEYVFIIGAEEASFPSPRRIAKTEIEEERRLAYVAITRGKKKVFMSGAKVRLDKFSSEMSVFASEISEKHKVYQDKSFSSYF